MAQDARKPTIAPTQSLRARFDRDPAIGGMLVATRILLQSPRMPRPRLPPRLMRLSIGLAPCQQGALAGSEAIDPGDRLPADDAIEDRQDQEFGHRARAAVGEDRHAEPSLRKHRHQRAPADPTAAV